MLRLPSQCIKHQAIVLAFIATDVFHITPIGERHVEDK